MDMTPDISKMFRVRQESKWNTLIQQDTALIRPFVTPHPNCRGKSVELPFHGKTRMKEYSGRLLKIEWSEMDFGKRHIKPRKFYDSIPLSEDDKLEMDTLELRATEVMGEQRNALVRMYDEVILGVTEDTNGIYRIRTQADGICGGVLGINYTGDDGSTVETIDTSENSYQVISADFAAKGTKTIAGMIIDKIAELRCRYQQINAWKAGKGDDIVVAISPRQHRDMILLEQTQNKNYGFASLTNGEINDFLGVKFLVTNMLPSDEEGNRLCCAWLRSRIKFGIWRDGEFRVESRSEYVDVREQITVKAALGATRLDNKTVFLMPCKE